MLTLPTLTTARLHLRPFTRQDVPRLAQLANDPRIAVNIGLPNPYTTADAHSFLDRLDTEIAGEKAFSLAIIITDCADLIGSIGCHLERRHARASFGYWIGVSYWGKGYATEAATAFVDHLFTGLNLHRVAATHNARNPASGRVMQKLGMTHEGTSRQNMRLGDGFVDDLHYGLLRAQWPGARALAAR